METPSQKKGGISRKWIWLVVAVLAVMGFGCIGCAGLTGAGVYGIFSLLKSNPAYKEALQLVENDSRAQAMLGTPIEAGWFVNGEVHESGPSGSAEFSIPVSGPKGSGRVDVVARKVNGEWIITLLQLVMDGSHERLLLIGEPVD